MQNNPSPKVIVRVTRPELTPEERAERAAEIKRAATGLIVATMREKAGAASA